MRPAVSIQTLARSAKAVVRARNTARARNGLRVQYQPITLTLAGYAQGRKIARKTRARPRNGRASSRAKPTPRLSLATLVTAAYTTVTVAARQNSGSARKRR